MNVELLDSMGDDLAIVNAARVSFGKESRMEWTCGIVHSDAMHTSNCPKQLKSADAGLISYLMRQRHGTPFEMVQFKFRIQVPIGVAREWQRHRIGSFNEVSTRYVEMQPDFYVPVADALRAQIGKPGHYQMVTIEDPAEQQDILQLFDIAYREAFSNYQALLERGVAKELARNVLPLGLLTEFIWSVNLRSLFNFLSPRTAPNALLEIRLAAQEVEALAVPIAPVAFAAFNEYGRKAP